MSTLPSSSTAASPAQPGRRSLLKRLSGALAGSFLASPLQTLLGHAPAAAASPLTGGYEPYVGEIIMVPYNFAPSGYALCDGQILAINSNNAALYSLLGVQFGGNGSTTFALPNLNGRVVVGAGQGPGLSNYIVGQSGGTDTVTLLPAQLPAHQHTMALTYSPEPGTTSSPQGAYLASNGSGQAQYAASGTGFTPGEVTASGAAHNNQQPYLNMVYCIALSGVYPQRP